MSQVDFAAIFPDEVLTRAHVRAVDVPVGAQSVRMALITLDNGADHTRPNTFGPAGLAELDQALDEAFAIDGVAAVALTGKPFGFAAGADLSGIGSITSREVAAQVGRAGHRVFSRLHRAAVPTFCFYNGLALGGGVEIGLHCDYRTVLTQIPAFGLPECYLGLVPGWGGCWLLPNLVGPERAVRVIIDNALNNNRMLGAAEVLALGIADAGFAAADFLEQSLRWAAEVVLGQRKVTRDPVDRDEATWEAALARATSIANTRTAKAAPAPYRAVELIRAARTVDRAVGFAAEDEALADLIMGEELRAGLYAFDLVQHRAKRPAGAPPRALARPVTSVGVVGAGLMASQLALLLLRRLEVPVVMTDLDQARVESGLGHVHGEIDKLVSAKRLSPDRANRLRGLLSGSTDRSVFAGADLVIEAVFEEMAVKKEVFAELEAVIAPECVLATNTSSLSVTEMAADLTHPERVVGMHFFNPVAVMPLLEVVAAERTDESSLATAFAVAATLKKTAVVVRDSPAFIVNRLLGRWMSETARIVDAGTPIPVADSASAGLAPMTPFVLLGLVGIPVALHTSQTLHEAFPDRFAVSANLRRLVAAGRSAVYTWVDGAPRLDPEVLSLFEQPADPVVLDRARVREQILDALAEEVGLMLAEGVVGAPEDIDLAMITGAGFPLYNGGLTPLLDRTGASERATGSRFLPRGRASLPPE